MTSDGGVLWTSSLAGTGWPFEGNHIVDETPNEIEFDTLVLG